MGTFLRIMYCACVHRVSCRHGALIKMPNSKCPHRNSGLSIEEFTELHNSVKRGDIVGVEGFPGKSRNGELSIFPAALQVLSPCLHMLPVARTGLKSQVTRPLTPRLSRVVE